MELKRKILFKDFILTKEGLKGKILSRSLLWMGLGLAIIVIVAYLSSTLDSFKTFMLTISTGSSWLVMWLINFGLIMGLFFTLKNTNISIFISVSLYSLFAFYEGIFISSILYFSNSLSLSNLLPLMLIPSAIFGIAGILAYFNLINFSKLIPFAMVGMLILIILGVALIFVQSNAIEKMYLFLATFVFTIWIGFDLQMIKKAEESFFQFNIDTQMMNRLSFMFGIRLFIDFVNLLFIAIRFINN